MVAFAELLGDLAAPWLVRYVAGWCAWIALAAWGLEAVGSVAMVAVTGWECLASRG